MRLKSEIWVKAYLRRCAGEGIACVVARRGDADAGVVYIKVIRLDGTASLYGPAIAGLEAEGGRLWMPLAEGVPEAEISARLEREAQLDTDLWIVEIEDRQGRHFLDGWLAPE